MSIHRLVRLSVLALMVLTIPALSFGGVFVSVSVGPPPIPVYTQPLCPGPGYMWTPGYWAWGDEGYYWVPGTWVMAPTPGLLWTPGYWGWSGGVYLWNGGYWGPHVGWYGGINYGWGYGGRGYEGGEWRGNNFYYNRTVNNVNVTNVTNVYNKTVVVNNNNHVSYNGGTGGVATKPTSQEQQYASEKHVEPTHEQLQHHTEAAKNPQLLAKNNGGKPTIAATAKPGDFQHAVPAKAVGGPVNKTALTATPKNMPPAKTSATTAANAKGGANVPKPSTTTANTKAAGSTSANATAHNVPKPPTAGSSTHANASTSASTHNVPKPPTTSTHSSAPMTSTTHASQPTQHTTATPHTSTPTHSTPPVQHSAAPVQHAAAPQQHSAPAPHTSSAPQHETKPHR